MNRRRAARLRALRSFVATLGMAAAAAARAACVTLASYPDGPVLAQLPIDDRDAAFRVTYVHSVTRTPVEEAYRIDGDRIVETELRFVEHGPGLPTAPDADGTFERRDGAFVVRGQRSFERIVMRVDAGQSPRLAAAARTVDLARWGNRALALTARASPCDMP